MELSLICPLFESVEFVGGVEGHRGQLAQLGSVELYVGGPQARVPLDLAVGILPASYDNLDACDGPAGASDVSPTGGAVVGFVDPRLDVPSVGGWSDAGERSGECSYG